MTRAHTLYDLVCHTAYQSVAWTIFFDDKPISPAPALVVVVEIAAEDTRWLDAQQEVACLMLASMTPELQKNLEDFNAYEMLKELKTTFLQQSEHELLETVKCGLSVKITYFGDLGFDREFQEGIKIHSSLSIYSSVFNNKRLVNIILLIIPITNPLTRLDSCCLSLC
ncbi:hypothetical protein CTI12_AA477460 [Artemisia annua]|uniref:Uncharacterized protein n=1 Tax=Artemisia annua TaxID=35608 RepID=A0A2U1LLG2_ARTAN|nr:hypothetical protein CTI12_AA477460 [Artemisia annua]